MRKLGAVILEAALYFIGLLVPRTNEVWVFGGNQGLRYADNSMHFFRHCHLAGSRRLVWLTRSTVVLKEVRAEGYEAHLIKSIKGTWLGLRARWHVFDVGPTDTGPTSRGAMRLNLWHGIPLKHLASIKRNKQNSSKLQMYLRHIFIDESNEYFVHPNKKYASHVLDAFNVPEQNILLANLPRNRVLLDIGSAPIVPKAHDLPWLDRIQAMRDQGRTIIGYFPTWRSDGGDRFFGASEPEHLDDFNEILAHHNCFVVTKWHTCSYNEYQHYGRSHTADGFDASISRQSNILALDFHTDLNSLLTLCDVLITDYSSVLFDFLLTGRPQFFVPYDLQRYSSNTGLLFDYESFVPGPIILDISQLIATIAALRENQYLDTYGSKRTELRATFFEEERCSEYIMEMMEAIA